jgi:hypothetical protein
MKSKKSPSVRGGKYSLELFMNRARELRELIFGSICEKIRLEELLNHRMEKGVSND